jgi:hypothetical protein
MAKWTLFPDEWYPVLQVNRYREGNPDGAREAEFTDDEIADLIELEVQFNYLQKQIAERFGLPLDHPTQFTLVYEDEGASSSRTSTRNAGRSE